MAQLGKPAGDKAATALVTAADPVMVIAVVPAVTVALMARAREPGIAARADTTGVRLAEMTGIAMVIAETADPMVKAVATVAKAAIPAVNALVIISVTETDVVRVPMVIDAASGTPEAVAQATGTVLGVVRVPMVIDAASEILAVVAGATGEARTLIAADVPLRGVAGSVLAGPGIPIPSAAIRVAATGLLDPMIAVTSEDEMVAVSAQVQPTSEMISAAGIVVILGGAVAMVNSVEVLVAAMIVDQAVRVISRIEIVGISVAGMVATGAAQAISAIAIGTGSVAGMIATGAAQAISVTVSGTAPAVKAARASGDEMTGNQAILQSADETTSVVGIAMISVAGTVMISAVRGSGSIMIDGGGAMTNKSTCRVRVLPQLQMNPAPRRISMPSYCRLASRQS